MHNLSIMVKIYNMLQEY